MRLSDNDLDSFIAANRADTAESIAQAEALEMAIKPIAFFELPATDPALGTASQAF